MPVRGFIEPVSQCPRACEGLGPIFGPPEIWRGNGHQPRSLETHPQRRRRTLRYRDRSVGGMSGPRCRLRKQPAQPAKHRMTIELIPIDLVGVVVQTPRAARLTGCATRTIQDRDRSTQQHAGREARIVEQSTAVADGAAVRALGIRVTRGGVPPGIDVRDRTIERSLCRVGGSLRLGFLVEGAGDRQGPRAPRRRGADSG